MEKIQVRAVTHWNRLAEKEDGITEVCDCRGYAVDGRVVECTADGKFNVELTGWTPVGAMIKRQVLSAEISNRRIAVVEVHDNFYLNVHLCVGAQVSRSRSSQNRQANIAR